VSIKDPTVFVIRLNVILSCSSNSLIILRIRSQEYRQRPFGNVDEVVTEALRLLRHREQKLDALGRDIQEGLDSQEKYGAVALDVDDIIRRGRIRLAEH
jgi:putative addiction module CopG family antidote